MSIALGATSSIAAGAQGGSGVALQAQLDRCTTQLSSWVNCASGKTPEGKQIIAALQAKISSIKHQLQQQNPGSGQGPAPVTPPASLALASIGSIGTILNTVA